MIKHHRIIIKKIRRHWFFPFMVKDIVISFNNIDCYLSKDEGFEILKNKWDTIVKY